MYLDEDLMSGKIGRRKQSTERELELKRWRMLYQDRIEESWANENLMVAMVSSMFGFALLSCFICIDNVSNLDWMYGYLKVVAVLIALFGAGFAVWAFFYLCVHINALFVYPYPFPKFNFKQTFKFGNQNGSK